MNRKTKLLRNLERAGVDTKSATELLTGLEKQGMDMEQTIISPGREAQREGDMKPSVFDRTYHESRRIVLPLSEAVKAAVAEMTELEVGVLIGTDEHPEALEGLSVVPYFAVEIKED
jgi:hypothetical protein